MANQAHTTPYDTRAIMKKAWSEYRFQKLYSEDQTFDRALFAQQLSFFWQCAKADRATEIKRAAEVARLAEASAVECRIANIEDEMFSMEMSNRMDWRKRAALKAELAGLAVAA